MHFWFSDERFVPERVAPNVMTVRLLRRQLLAPLLSHGLVVGNVHRMGPSDIFTGLEVVAWSYAFEMRDYAGSAPAVRRADAEAQPRHLPPLAGGHGGGAGHEHGAAPAAVVVVAAVAVLPHPSSPSKRPLSKTLCCRHFLIAESAAASGCGCGGAMVLCSGGASVMARTGLRHHPAGRGPGRPYIASCSRAAQAGSAGTGLEDPVEAVRL